LIVYHVKSGRIAPYDTARLPSLNNANPHHQASLSKVAFLQLLYCWNHPYHIFEVPYREDIMADNKNTSNDASVRDDGPVDAEVVRLIREEVRAAVNDHVQESMRAPPSYDSTAPLLGVSATSDDPDPEAQQSDQTKLEAAKMAWNDWVRLVLGMFPSMFILIGWAVLISAGVDPLMFGLLTTALMMVMLLVAILVGCKSKFNRSLKWAQLLTTNRLPC
jgi:hypothetical protein